MSSCSRKLGLGRAWASKAPGLELRPVIWQINRLLLFLSRSSSSAPPISGSPRLQSRVAFRFQVSAIICEASIAATLPVKFSYSTSEESSLSPALEPRQWGQRSTEADSNYKSFVLRHCAIDSPGGWRSMCQPSNNLWSPTPRYDVLESPP